jgi:nuclear respiratory factor 1
LQDSEKLICNIYFIISFKCFGAKPLEDVVRNLRPVIMQDLESSLAQHAPAPAPEDPSLHELPPLVIDGIPTPVEKMTQVIF